MYNLENLTSEITRYQDAKRGYLNADFDHLPVAEIDTLRRAYDDAAHSVAFHAAIVCESLSSLTYPASDASQFFIPAPDQAPNLSQHDRLRQMFDEPELPAGGYDVCRDCGERRSLDEFARCASCAAARLSDTEPEPSDQAADSVTFLSQAVSGMMSVVASAMIESEEADTPDEPTLYVSDGDALYRLKVANGHVRVERRGSSGTESQLTYELNVWGRPLNHDRYWNLAVVREVIDRYDTDVDQMSQDEWLTAATELDLQCQSGDSGDLFDDYDDYDDYYERGVEQSYSRWITKANNGHITIGVGILTKYPGEDWGEASGWEEEHYNLNRYSDEFKQRVIAFVKDKAPGQYDIPSPLDEDEDEDEPDTDTSTGATTVDEIQF